MVVDEQTRTGTTENRPVSSAAIVYVHGMWMPAVEMLYLKHYLHKHHALPGYLFDYPSVGGGLDENAALLNDFVLNIDADQVHLVGHSLGGVVSLRMLSLYPDSPPGKIVCIGSPLCGARAANVLNASGWGSRILGKTVSEGVIQQSADKWAASVVEQRDVGSIAGTTSAGLGRLIADFHEANDGTVAVSETQLPGITDHICMTVSHSGLVLSSDVAAQVAAFILEGAFRKADK